MSDDRCTTEEAAAALNVPAATIRKWKSRGLIEPVGLLPGPGRGGQGSPLYRLDELRPLAERYHATRRRNPRS